jgi:diacylglycerol kinase family enzyme
VASATGAVTQCFATDPDNLDAALDLAFGRPCSAVVVMGGDGTLRSAAKRALQSGIPIAALPGGTMNVLAKLLLGHDDLRQAIAQLPTLQRVRLDVGYAQKEPFFLSAAFGFAGPLTRLREALRSPRSWSACAKAAQGVIRGIGPSLRGGVGWRSGGGRWSHAHTLIIALGSIDRVLNPSTYDMSDGEPATMQIAALRMRTSWDVARTVGYALAADWKGADTISMARHGAVELDLRTRRPLVVLDGEPMRLSRVAEAWLVQRALPALAAVSPRSVL